MIDFLFPELSNTTKSLMTISLLVTLSIPVELPADSNCKFESGKLNPSEYTAHDLNFRFWEFKSRAVWEPKATRIQHMLNANISSSRRVSRKKT